MAKSKTRLRKFYDSLLPESREQNEPDYDMFDEEMTKFTEYLEGKVREKNIRPFNEMHTKFENCEICDSRIEKETYLMERKVYQQYLRIPIQKGHLIPSTSISRSITFKSIRFE